MNGLEKIRQENPLVACHTNDVAKSLTANGLLSIGASPAMSEAPEEAEEFYKIAGALLINIGALTKANEKDILEIGKTANRQGTPVVFNPVAADTPTYRKQFCESFLSEINVSVIKGNASEILTLVDSNTTMKGTDGKTDLDVVTIARKAYEKYQTAVVIIGREDVIIQDNQIARLSSGSPLLAKITGAGCLLGSLVAGFLFKNTHPSLQVLEEPVSYYNIVTEIVEKNEKVNEPGTFLSQSFDEMYQPSYDTYKQFVKRKEV